MSAAQKARLYIVVYTLAITSGLMIFLALAQPLGMRFDYAKQENFRLIDVILPTFLAYLGAASHFIFNAGNGREVNPAQSSILMILVHGPFTVFILFIMSLFYTHYVTHIPIGINEPRVAVLDYPTLSRYVSLGLGLLAATTGVISSYLFGSPPTADRKISKVPPRSGSDNPLPEKERAS